MFALLRVIDPAVTLLTDEEQRACTETFVTKAMEHLSRNAADAARAFKTQFRVKQSVQDILASMHDASACLRDASMNDAALLFVCTKMRLAVFLRRERTCQVFPPSAAGCPTNQAILLSWDATSDCYVLDNVALVYCDNGSNGNVGNNCNPAVITVRAIQRKLTAELMLQASDVRRMSKDQLRAVLASVGEQCHPPSAWTKATMLQRVHEFQDLDRKL